ncbi:MAG: hypothetical protein IPJ79_07360 [Bacteroidetes bacterium]|nr:hypothetical protein [Bacteroidota bacterium]
MAKYDVNGNYLLANNTGGPSGMITVPQMYQDVNGNLYIVGRFFGTFDFDPGLNSYNLSAFGTFDILFSKYDSNFNFYWARNMGGQYFD